MAHTKYAPTGLKPLAATKKPGAGLVGKNGKPHGAAPHTGKPGKPGKPHGATPLPYDANYQAYLAQQNRNFGLAQADHNYQVGQVAYTTGLNQNGTANASNPYSEAALLKENFNRSTAGTLNSYAGQGQLYSGAYGRQQGENARGYSMGYNSLANQAGSSYHGLEQSLSQAAADSGTGLTAQARLALYRALYPNG